MIGKIIRKIRNISTCFNDVFGCRQG